MQDFKLLDISGTYERNMWMLNWWTWN